MDPDATVREMAANNAALEHGEITRRQWRRADTALRNALHEWRAKGGFPPKNGWPKGL